MAITLKEHARRRFTHHLADGETWIGIYENKALDSSNLGRRIALFFDLRDWDGAEIGDRAPDTPQLTGWKYLLVHKAKSTDEAVQHMNFAE